jgi:hypothetical protein
MGRLKEICSTSSLMDIEIEYDDEVIKFNLNQELQIKEVNINQDLKNQPAIYSFVSMLHKKMLKAKADKQNELEKAYARSYINIKSALDPNTNRPYSNDTAKEQAILDIKYQRLLKSYNNISDKVNVLEVCVKSFEQKAFLIQTISANLRKEN